MVDAFQSPVIGNESILAKVRAEGRREGIAQMSMVCFDEAFEEGRLAAQRDAAGEAVRWFRVGVVLGIAIAVLIGAFF